jgi:hypothetical protein
VNRAPKQCARLCASHIVLGHQALKDTRIALFVSNLALSTFRLSKQTLKNGPCFLPCNLYNHSPPSFLRWPSLTGCGMCSFWNRCSGDVHNSSLSFPSDEHQDPFLSTRYVLVHWERALQPRGSIRTVIPSFALSAFSFSKTICLALCASRLFSNGSKGEGATILSTRFQRTDSSYLS